MKNSSSDAESGKLMPHSLLLYVVFPVVLFFAATAWSPPFIYDNVSGWVTSWQKALFSSVCHQQIDRTYQFGGVPLAVCSRCIGIYTAALTGLVTFSFFFALVNYSKRYITRIFIIGSFVIVIDGIANLIGIWHSVDFLRTIIGAVWGFTVGGLLVLSLSLSRKT